MSEAPADDQMIEIGDPTEELTSDGPAPQVVIEYHERGGVPWMLIPPLLVLSAVSAILLYTRFAPHALPPVPSPVLVQSSPVSEPAVPDRSTEAPSRPVVAPEPVIPAELEREKPPQSPVADPSPVGISDGLPSIPTDGAAEPVKVVEPPPPARIQGLGFDPRALENERKDEPRNDPALAPVAREEGPADPAQPREVDQDLLPPDPREARLRQEQRRTDILNRINEERSRYHVELKEICRKFRENSGPAILDMWKQFNVKTDPKAEKSAVELLGKNGKFASADRRMRVELLRSLGFPEPVILDYLFTHYEKRQIGERDGPRDLSEAYYFSALFLLGQPPRPSVPALRPVSAPSGRSLGGTRPAR